MKISFKRITTSGNFIPEVDGLRFIAIFSIVAYHLSGFILVKDLNSYTDHTNFSLFKRIMSHTHLGIPLFFIISGFVLGLPFAKYWLTGGKKVVLKAYFLRRLTRLEPPYIIVMTVLLFGAVYVAKIVSLELGIASYFASIIYAHNFIFDVLPILNGSAWSLEVEVQFYVLVPVLTYVYAIKSDLQRRLLLVGVIISFLIFNNVYHMPFRSLINYSQFFFTGLLLADLYTKKLFIFPKSRFDIFVGFFFFAVIWLYEGKDFDTWYQKSIWMVFQLTCIFFLYYFVIFHKAIRFFSIPAITNIGGMCYSIYLLHYPIISLFGNPLLEFSFSSLTFINISIYSIILMLLVLVISAAYFVIVERPCMERDWYKKTYYRISSAF
jgi:peptidoglycan/LPS O-acetylase OafA/YrhL